MSLLEAAVREHLGNCYRTFAQRNERFDPETIVLLQDRRAAELLAVLRETLSEEATPTSDDLFRAEMEATNRTIQRSIDRMRNPSTQDPRRREILAAIADDAEQSLAAFRTIGPEVTQERLNVITEGVVERQRALNRRFFPNAPEPPAPQ